MTVRNQAKRKASKAKARRSAGSARRKRVKPANLRLMREAPTARHTKRAADAAHRRGRRAVLPKFVKPCLATLVDHAPHGDNWIHEIKFDGYRIQARLQDGKAKLFTRKGLDWTNKFPSVAEAVAKLPADTALIDGELVAEDKDGVSRFSLLQQDIKGGRHDRMALYVFDLMHLDGADLKPVPLSERKAALAKMLGRGRKRGPLRFSESINEAGPSLLKHACRLGLEGIISKVADAPYRSGRGRDWLKTKCSDRQEFVVAGFAPSSADAHAVGALVLAVHDHGKLRYAGRTGTGFTHDVARSLYRKLKALARKTSPFEPVPKDERGTRKPVWVAPRTVVEVDFHGWTHGDRVRQASFQGVREDKSAKDVVREKTA
jgi:bifunctional non-homologous end joining protein LigD